MIVIVIVTGGKQSQLLVFWTWLGLEFDKNFFSDCLHSGQWPAEGDTNELAEL